MSDQHVSQQGTGQQHERNDRSGFVYNVKRRLTSLPWLARAAGAGLSSVSIGFVGLFLFVLETGGDLTLIARPVPMQVALALPAVIAFLTAVTTVGAGLAWWNNYWSLRARIHQTILALLGLGFCWQLATLGFLPP
ncbi:hypothetical protein [Haloarcula nitratireducens]|uniref:Uncharacterized protein n=1 Tax=Haloarcula nitratireducens TaxID=2487749 RepID=A0AAW4PIN8_9EURY|nr:hypothetical protein [Halomicroarcula nitratireducens]MBX0297622.1 hypothetical protein [Halomicroarcula nitratireducens]